MQNTSNLSHHSIFPGLSSHRVQVIGVLVFTSLFKLNKPGHDASNHCLGFTELQTFCLGNLPLPHLCITLYCHHRTRTKIKFSLNYYRLTTHAPNNFKLLHHYTPHFSPDSISHISHKAHLCIPSLTKQMESLPFVIMKHISLPSLHSLSSPQKKRKRTTEMAN